MVTLKIQYGEDIRRVSLDTPKFASLKDLLRQLFPNLNASYLIKWRDDEDDLVTVTSDIELREAVDSSSNTILRLFIVEASTSHSVTTQDEAATVDVVEPLEGPIHPNVVCDGCNNLVIGNRYKCVVCQDFDLCEQCENQQSHDASHPMLKIQQPVTSDSFAHPRMKPSRRSTPDFNWKPRPFCRPHKSAKFNWLPNEDLNKNSAVTAEDSEPKMEETPAISRGWGNFHGWSNLAPAKFQPPATRPNYLARFVSDVSIADGTSMAPNESFVKTWRIRNEGSTEWPAGSQLILVGGDSLGAPGSIEVPTTASGAEVDVSVNMVSPSRPGRYVGYWRMVHDGQRFGQRVWVDIIVTTPPSPSMNANNSSTQTEETTQVEEHPISSEMESICRQLADMGFTDRSNNIALLTKYDNSLIDVLTVLLQ